MVDQIRFFAGAARCLEGRSSGEYMTGMTSMIRREPIGVCAQVTPWNYPMMMAVWKWAPAIAAEVENTGKPIGLTRTEEIPPMVDQIRFFAGAARMLEGRSAGEYMEGMTSIVRREPVGVCAQVAPWNYPMMMAVWKFAPAIAAGNTVVLKPSTITPLTALALAEIAADIFPKGVFNVVTGPGAVVGQRLVTHPDVVMVSLTGDTGTG